MSAAMGGEMSPRQIHMATHSQKPVPLNTHLMVFVHNSAKQPLHKAHSPVFGVPRQKRKREITAGFSQSRKNAWSSHSADIIRF